MFPVLTSLNHPILPSDPDIVGVDSIIRPRKKAKQYYERLVKLHQGREGRGSNHQKGEGEEQKLYDDCAQI
ncbi:hypothetical protein BC938DRAFT_482331 [Jimgerdemannia flammicorona]|uniref:Uncharacterized protein n=1 Tax=Jimgerdemannia flammicorona TaxID=994334 RepID=A0A433QE55_9FUNG|nr:hypothetical protein BC938DRAFT_482331 [Jimgerdemannia flammicorona]